MEGVSDWIQRLVLQMWGEAMYPGSLYLLRLCCGKWRWPPPLFFTNRWNLPPTPLIAYPQQSTSRSTA